MFALIHHQLHQHRRRRQQEPNRWSPDGSIMSNVGDCAIPPELYCYYGNYSDYQPIIAKYLSTTEEQLSSLFAPTPPTHSLIQPVGWLASQLVSQLVSQATSPSDIRTLYCLLRSIINRPCRQHLLSRVRNHPSRLLPLVLRQNNGIWRTKGMTSESLNGSCLLGQCR